MQQKLSMRNQSLIRKDSRIRTLLSERFKELGITQKEVIEDAGWFDFIILPSNLNRYLKNNEKGEGRNTLTEPQILWLCNRYCINVSIVVLPEKYNYVKAKKKLNGKES